MEASGWRTVAGALAAQAGAGFAVRFQPHGAGVGDRTGDARAGIVLSVSDLGTWTVSPNGASGEAPALSVPLRESLALAERLEKGLALSPAELEAVLDPLPYAALLLDGDARLLFANAAGEDLLASRSLFRPARRGAHLVPARGWIDEAMETAVARVLEKDHPGARWVARGPGATHLVIRVRPVGPARPDRGGARILVTLRAIGFAPRLSG